MARERNKTLLDKIRGAQNTLRAGFAAAGIALLSGCATLQTSSPEPEYRHMAGSVYLADAIGFADEESLESMLDQMKAEFAEIGIRFEEARIIETQNVPEIGDLDVVAYITSNPGILAYGVFQHTPENSSTAEYSEDLVKLHGDQTIYMFPEDYVEKYAKECECSPTEEKRTELAARILIHEVGHSLGAGHVLTPKFIWTLGKILPSPAEGYKMGASKYFEETTIHPENVARMKAFIDKVRIEGYTGACADYLRNESNDKKVMVNN